MEKLQLNPIISVSSFGTDNPRWNYGLKSRTQGTGLCITPLMARMTLLTSQWHNNALTIT